MGRLRWGTTMRFSNNLTLLAAVVCVMACLSGCPAPTTNNPAVGTWICSSFMPTTGLTVVRDAYFWPDGTLELSHESGGYYELSYYVDTEGVHAFGYNELWTEDGIVTVEHNMTLHFLNADTMTGETWMTVDPPDGEVMTIYMTEQLVKQ
jgi:hypothetical protein